MKLFIRLRQSFTHTFFQVTQDLQTFKLADFGLARVVERTEQYKTVKGTYRYMAPEILKRSTVGGAKYSLTVDVYSYGKRQELNPY